MVVPNNRTGTLRTAPRIRPPRDAANAFHLGIQLMYVLLALLSSLTPYSYDAIAPQCSTR